MKQSLRDWLHKQWEKGFLYIAVASILYTVYIFSARVGVLDWQKEAGYFQHIVTSISQFHSLPVFWWDIPKQALGYPAVRHSSFFLANPETMLLSPLLPLTYILDTISYVKVLCAIHFLVGLMGLFLLRRQLNWDGLQFRTYACLFLLSPIVIQHLAVGYTPWLNIFFFPLLVYFISQERILYGSLGVSLVLSLVLLQGGAHVFVWFLMFFILYTFFATLRTHMWRSGLLRTVIVLLGIIALSFVRISTSSRAYADFHQSFQVGYNLLNFLVWSEVPPVLIFPFDSFFLRKVWFGVPSWDGGMYWGLSLLLFAVVLLRFKKFQGVYPKHRSGLDHSSLLISSSILFALSFSSVFEFCVLLINRMAQIPFAEGVEKYPFRLMIPAYLGYSVLAGEYSANIWQTISSWLIARRVSAILSRLSSLFIYLCAVVSIIAVSGLLVSMIFSGVIQSRMVQEINDAYYGVGSQWLSNLIQNRGTEPLGHYLSLLGAKYFQLQFLLCFVAIFAFLTLLSIKEGYKISSPFSQARYFRYEIALAMPLLFASGMWFALGSSIPFEEYVKKDGKEATIVNPGMSSVAEVDIRITPETAIINLPKQADTVEVLLSKVPWSDKKFLELVSGKAELRPGANGSLSLLISNSDEVTLAVKREIWEIPLFVTIGAFALLMILAVIGSTKSRW